MTERLYLAVMPVRDPDGSVHRFVIARPDGKHLSEQDFVALRAALGQDPLSREELDSYGVPDWAEE